MHRRTFLQYVLALGAIHALPTWCRTTLAADRPALPIPNLLQADAAGNFIVVSMISKGTHMKINAAPGGTYSPYIEITV